MRCEGVVMTRWTERTGQQCRRNARFTDGAQHLCFEHAKELAYVTHRARRELKPGWRMTYSDA